jgi:hypothetical protein
MFQKIRASKVYRRARRNVATIGRPFALFELATIYRKDLTAPADAFKIDDLDIGQATAEEVQRAAESLGRPNPQRAELFRWRLRDGCVCFVARSGSAIVAYVWIRYRAGLDDGLLIALGPGEVYSFDLFVDEILPRSYRGRVCSSRSKGTRQFTHE